MNTNEIKEFIEKEGEDNLILEIETILDKDSDLIRGASNVRRIIGKRYDFKLEEEDLFYFLYILGFYSDNSKTHYRFRGLNKQVIKDLKEKGLWKE